ncbi:MAG: MerR family DNA-binding transcriptional regulator, partial [Chloroflexota bacterium]
MTDKYLRTSEVKEKCSITRLTLYKWEQEGLIDPARTPGGHRRYSQGELEDLLGIESHTKQGGCVCGRVSTRKQEDNLARQVRR